MKIKTAFLPCLLLAIPFPSAAFALSADTQEVIETVRDVRNAAIVGRTGMAAVDASRSGLVTLSATGEVLGGGVLTGTALMSGFGGLGAASLMNRYLYTQGTQADDMAQIGTYTGAVVGTAGSLGTLALVGTGTGELAAIGGLVGGGMAAGAVAVIAAPVVMAAAVGGLAYWLFSDEEPLPPENMR